MITESLTTMRELDSRLVDGLHVRLWWDPEASLVWVSVLDTRSGEAFSIEVKAGQEPLDVFREYMAAFSVEQARCHLSPALVRNLEVHWNAPARRI